MRNLHGLLMLVLLAYILTSFAYADEKQMSAIVTDSKAVAAPTKNKQPNFQHLEKPKNGDVIRNVKKPPEKIKKPEVWHPKIKGLE